MPTLFKYNPAELRVKRHENWDELRRCVRFTAFDNTLTNCMMTDERFESCIDACIACAIACEHCASQCLKEESVKMMIRCIELDRECSSVCRSAAELMSMGGPHASLLCNACADICEACARECAMHDMDHCQECAEECEACAEACRKMVEHAV